jgi:hypothetical protein
LDCCINCVYWVALILVNSPIDTSEIWRRPVIGTVEQDSNKVRARIAVNVRVNGFCCIRAPLLKLIAIYFIIKDE